MIVCVAAGFPTGRSARPLPPVRDSLEYLQFDLGVATQCGRCADCATRVLCDARAQCHAHVPLAAAAAVAQPA